ncbi:unnamed protein product, partial [Chrysoparadoxa australica]
FEAVFATLQLYHKAYGSLNIPHTFVCPSWGPWPELCRGWKLSRCVYNMKFFREHLANHQDRREALTALGFVWGRLQPEYNIVLEALVTYKYLHGDLMVPGSFVVPLEPPWPAATWGMKLGNKVVRMRSKHLYLKTKPERWFQLHEMGFVWDRSEQAWCAFYKALKEYKTIHGSTSVPTGFVVPSSSQWSQDLWGLRLGRKLQSVKANSLYLKHHPQRIRSLKSIGFTWAGAREQSYSRLIKAIQAFRSIVSPSSPIPSSFIVPYCEPWPQPCWGLHLGTALVDVRSKGRLE